MQPASPPSQLIRLTAGLALAASLLGGATSTQANLLSNGDFNTSNLAGWATWNSATWDGFIEVKTNATSIDGTPFFNVGNWGNGSGGITQTAPATPGLTYVFSADCSAIAWWRPEAEMRLIFLDAVSNELARTTLVTIDPNLLPGWDTAKPWARYSLSATAPANTTEARVELIMDGGTVGTWGGGEVHFDNAVLAIAPTISGVTPDGSVLMQVSSTLAFTATSTTTNINASGLQLVINGVNVTSNLVIIGSAASKTATLSGLQTNRVYSAVISATDAGGVTATRTVTFDTFEPALMWEAEDWDFSTDGVVGGKFIDNPVLSSVPGPDNYYLVSGLSGIDYVDNNNGGSSIYRPETMATGSAGDVPRQKFLDAQAFDPAVQDYAIGAFYQGEWVNYTRTFPAGQYNLYARLSTAWDGAAPVDRVTSGHGTSTQTTSALGSFKYVAHGWNTFDYVPLTDPYSNLVAVSLSGVETLRVNGAGLNLNFLMLVPARLDIPVIGNVYPDGRTLQQNTNRLSFTAVSLSATIPTNGIQLTLNGTDVSAALVIAGSSTARTVSYAGLKLNTTYTATIRVVDANGTAASTTVHFDTFSPVLSWEAEDWDFDGGQFLNNPAPTSVAAANSYFGRLGVQGVDENETGTDPASSYRAGDPMHAGVCGDVPRQKFLDAQALDPNVKDWNVGYFDGGEWVNYTRTLPAGTYNVYGRVANGWGGTASVSMQQVVSGQGTTSQGTVSLGSFQWPGDGWNTYHYAPLRDRFGNLAEVACNGTTTLRITAGGANMNFFMLAAPRNDLPRISQVYPDGATQLQATNTFRFSVSNPSVPIYSTNITLTLNGTDVSAQISVAGSPAGWNVTAPLALNVPRYTAAITVRDASNNVATTQVIFDTFAPSSFVWEAEDYDFTSDGVTGGQFINNPTLSSAPEANSYFGQYGLLGQDYDITNILTGAAYLYRGSDQLGTDLCGDYPPLQKFVTARLTDPAIQDYNLAWWTANSWANYTRNFAAGSYYVYGRLAGGADFSVALDEVTPSATNRLGQIKGQNWGYGTYSWWPLVDANNHLVPVSLGGIQTLRLTTDGNVNANRYLLVPAPGTMSLTASLNGGSVKVSFPTQIGYNYQVYYKNSLADATWSLLTSVAGDGSIKSVNDSTVLAQRFYRILVQ